MESVIRRIKADPRSWDQMTWAVDYLGGPECGTAYCVAGHAIVESGYEFLRRDNALVGSRLLVVVPENSALRHIADKAEVDLYPPNLSRQIRLASPGIAGAELLGINAEDAGLLFNPLNKFSEILLIIEDFATADGYDWPEDLRLTEQQRATLDAIDDGRFGDPWDALMVLEKELLYPEEGLA
jgi:hypothetical protein